MKSKMMIDAEDSMDITVDHEDSFEGEEDTIEFEIDLPILPQVWTDYEY